MRLPDFLVIGAMKSATTMFYHDLAAHPQIFLAEKELGALTRDGPMAEYAAHFQAAKSHQLCGDVSTVYSMLPDVPGVAKRAARHLSANTKIFYLIREPIQRAISHHYHYYSLRDERRMEADINTCARKYPCLTNYGKYGEQLECWTHHWNDSAMHVVHFEDYIANRRETMAQVFRFLGISPSPHALAAESAKNSSFNKPVLNGFWRRLTRLRFYRRFVRPHLSLAVRDRVRALVLPVAPPPPAPPTPDTIDQLLSIFISDGQRLAQLTNRTTPFWDYSAVRSAHIKRWLTWHAAVELRKSA